MKTNSDTTASLAINALDDIPEAKNSAKSITGLVKSGSRVTGYQLSDGEIIDKETGVSMAKNGDISGVGIAHRQGKEYLKSIPDGTENNNLSHLPTVSAKVE